MKRREEERRNKSRGFDSELCLGARRRPQSRLAEGQGGTDKMNDRKPLNCNTLGKAIWSLEIF